jgi:glucokinase
MNYIGLDIGGTKCAVTLAEKNKNEIIFKEKISFKTSEKKYTEVIELFSEKIGNLCKEVEIGGIGISCGGPLDSKNGIIQSPPNLPNWDNVKITEYFEKKHGIKTYLQNDANACAVAEWRYGAGKDCQNMVFLTLGTGLGAGLILNGKLYSGTNDNAGEVGHIRLTKSGPIGYNKAGSAEGYCSGGGIRQLGIIEVKKKILNGEEPLLLKTAGNLENINAKIIAELAREGDSLCINIYKKSGEMLGKTLSYLIDILNPERIIIGGVFMRSKDLLLPYAEKVMEKECLNFSKKVCEILPAGLGEQVGDYAAISIADGGF